MKAVVTKSEEKQIYGDQKSILKIKDKKAVTNVDTFIDKNKNKFGYGGSLQSNRIAEIRDDNYFCCSSSCGSATMKKISK